jgi:hypothetical protein
VVSGNAMEAAERRLGTAIPDELRAFYLCTNGIDWTNSPGEYLGPLHGRFPSIDELCVGGKLVPPLSVVMSRDASSFDDHERYDKVEVREPNILALTEPPMGTLEFSELDAFLVLRWPSASSACLLMAHRPGLPYPEGTVLDVENFNAVRYVSLAHWLNANASLHQ